MLKEHLPECYKAIVNLTTIMKAPIMGLFFLSFRFHVAVNKYLPSQSYGL